MVTRRLADVRARMATAAGRANRPADEVALVVVTKGRPDADVLAAYEEGHRDFGENRAQDLAARASRLPDDIRWHFVGSLQRRKVPLVRPLTVMLHSMDRLELLESWSKGTDDAPPVLIQVNLGQEHQKHGIPQGGVAELLDAAAARGVEARGLMAIPPKPDTAEDSRRWFRAMRSLREDLREGRPHLTELSMGMSADFEVAIEEGATLIRVGGAIFGPSNVDTA